MVELDLINLANPNKLSYVGSIPKKIRDSDSWYTPRKYIDAAVEVLDTIELDPYSSEFANNIVNAKVFYTIKNPCNLKEWDFHTVWMNPPYSSGGIKQAVDKFIQEYKKYKFNAIVLTNNATETKWFQTLAELSTAMCFTNHRISFENVDGKNKSNNTRGQVFFYFGNDVNKFIHVFNKFGLILKGALT